MDERATPAAQPDAPSQAEPLPRHRTASQKFFVELALEMRKPSFGDRDRGLLTALLIRAQEAGLYEPEHA